MAPWWLQLYVFVLIAASVAWAIEVLQLTIRAVWRKLRRQRESTNAHH